MATNDEEQGSRAVTRTVTLHNGTRCTCVGGTYSERPAREHGWDYVTVHCTYGGEPSRPLRFQVGWDVWPESRLVPALEAYAGLRTTPRSQDDAPNSVEPGSIVETWNRERGYCRTIRWRANGRQLAAEQQSPSWSSLRDMPISAGRWSAWYPGDPPRPVNRVEFEAPSDAWWSSVGVVRVAMDVVDRGQLLPG